MSKDENRPGMLVVISGPAGSGKGTAVGLMMEKDKSLAYSVSATTRAPRPGEEHGKHYFFLSREEFEARIAGGRMLEHAEYCGNFYGTPKDETEAALSEGKTVILEIDVQGAAQVKKLVPDALLIMIIPPSYEVLEARLRGRGTETEDSVKKRLARASAELDYLPDFDYIMINEDGKVDEVADSILGAIEAERHSVKRNKNIKTEFFGK